MLADLFHAPGETSGTSTQGSSEAIMLGALSLKWKWRERRQAASKSTDKPNLVFGGDVRGLGEVLPLLRRRAADRPAAARQTRTIGFEDVEPHLDENTIGVAAVVGTTFTGHADDVVGINELLVGLRDEKGLDIPLHIDGASGAFVWPFLYPDTKWDFRLEQVRSITGKPGTKPTRYPGVGWLIFREKSDLAEDLRLLRELPGQDRRDLHPQLLHGVLDGAGAVLQLRSFRQGGLPVDHVDHAEERGGTRRRHRWDRTVSDHRRGRGEAAPGGLQPRRGPGV